MANRRLFRPRQFTLLTECDTLQFFAFSDLYQEWLCKNPVLFTANSRSVYLTIQEWLCKNPVLFTANSRSVYLTIQEWLCKNPVLLTPVSRSVYLTSRKSKFGWYYLQL